MGNVTRKYILIISAALVVATMVWLQTSMGNKFADPDGYYHTAMGELWKRGVVDGSFPWLQETLFKDNFADQHFLLHILLIPFNSIVLGKVFIILSVLLFLLSFLGLLKQMRVGFPAFWLFILIFSSSGFLFRINLLKAESLSLACLFLAITFYLKQKHWQILLLGITYTLLYSGGMLLLPAVLSIIALSEYLINKKNNVKLLCFVALGIFIGWIVHPQQENLLIILKTQLSVPYVKELVKAGIEWLPYSGRELIYDGGIMILALLISIFATVHHWKKDSLTGTQAWTGTIAILFTIGLLVSRRFVTYAAPFVVLYSAMSLRPYLEKLNWQKYKQLFFRHWQIRLSTFTTIAILLTMVYVNIRQTYRYISTSTADNSYKKASEWLSANTPQQSIVFNAKWDQFPQLFFYNTRNYYIVGLDPTFMYVRNSDLYWKWRLINEDNPAAWEDNTVYEIIKNDFQSSYIFLEKHRNPNLYLYINSNNEFTLTYEDDNTAIFAIK